MINDDLQTMLLEVDKARELDHDLAIWWEAYRAAIPPVTHQDTIIDIANDALAAYKAKAAELSKTCK